VRSKPKVAIIGAGLAGLTAAYRLFQRGIDFDIYEARNRVGGRVLSALMKNYRGDFSVVELGGQSITDGGEATNFFHLAQEFDLSIESQEVDLCSRIYYQGQYVDFQKQLSNYLKAHPTLLDSIDSLASQCNSMEELIKKSLIDDPILQSAFATSMTAYEGINIKHQSIYHNLETFKCMLAGGLSTSQEHYGHEENQITIKNIEGGNAQLPIKIAKLLSSHLFLNKVLRKIDKIDSQFHLIFQDESTANYDRVILAVPASTYKNIRLSDNILVHERWERMQSLGYGENYKIFCPFNLGETLTHRSIITEPLRSFFTNDQSIAILYANQPIQDIEKEIEIVRKGYNIHDKLETMTVQIAEDQIQCSYTQSITYSWIENPYSLGSYSGYSTTLSTALDAKTVYGGEEFKALFKPSPDGLFFIGEHTTLLDYVGTMEAAIESAERVAKLFQKTA
jgi:monoamine oxidase